MATAVYLALMTVVLVALFFIYAAGERERRRHRCTIGLRRRPCVPAPKYWSYDPPESEQTLDAVVRTPENSRGWR